jgi:hypothetical protein
MWGNALGWTISLLLVVLTAAAVHWVDQSARTISAPTAFAADPNNAPAIVLPVSPSTLLDMSDPADAAAIYRGAIDDYQQQPNIYDRFALDGRLRDVDSVPAVDSLTAATHSASAKIFAAHPAQIINYNSDNPNLVALKTLAACAIRVGQLIDKDQLQRAMQLYEAAFSLGAKLYQERLTYAELDAGLTMMAQSATLIGIGDLSRADAAKRFNGARSQFVTAQLQPTLRIISSIDQNVLEQHAGDVFYFAKQAGDRMWRVEAILKVGRYRFNAGRVGDQRAAEDLLQQLSGDPDPVIRIAADAAKNLTQPQYRMLH